MQFEILSEISDMETIATGSGIREVARLRRLHGRAAGANARERLACGSPMALSARLNYTGTKPPDRP
jgi:hypothetical protein